LNTNECVALVLPVHSRETRLVSFLSRWVSRETRRISRDGGNLLLSGTVISKFANSVLLSWCVIELYVFISQKTHVPFPTPLNSFDASLWVYVWLYMLTNNILNNMDRTNTWVPYKSVIFFYHKRKRLTLFHKLFSFLILD